MGTNWVLSGAPRPRLPPLRSVPRQDLREPGEVRDEAGETPRAPSSSARPHDAPRRGPLDASSCELPTQSTRTRKPAPRARGPLEPARPSRAGRCLLRPLRLLPAGATVAGPGSYPLGYGALPRRTGLSGLAVGSRSRLEFPPNKISCPGRESDTEEQEWEQSEGNGLVLATCYGNLYIEHSNAELR